MTLITIENGYECSTAHSWNFVVVLSVLLRDQLMHSSSALVVCVCCFCCLVVLIPFVTILRPGCLVDSHRLAPSKLMVFQRKGG